MASFNVSIEELKSHHAIDRHLYARLTAELGRDPDQAMQVMAFWLWLEEMGFPSIILAVRTLPDRLLHTVYDEAILCLAAIESENPQELTGDQVPITYYSLFDGGISLQFLHENRGFVMDDIAKTLTEVCTKIFDVGLEDLNALAPIVDPFVKQFRPGGEGRIVVQEIERPGPGRIIMPNAPFIRHGLHPAFSPLLHFRGIGHMPNEGQQSIAPLFVPGFCPKDGALNFEMGESSNPAVKKPQKDSCKGAPLDGNVIFLIFSREDPSSEQELRDYFSSTYGDVVEEIIMEETPVQVVPLFARVTFRSQETVDAIMDGNERMQLTINGKPVWARVYIPRE